ncbi:putative phage-encoded peptidoglycan binding protein [Paraburkholderia caribensis MBA4]|uniref:Putative phage-encoded peptidoglycan binding protein n=1 Tax=Paraburkholderia caribensis MBA4 TaxID=1323664 RepID=A0A0P0RJC1_9BURK|nr:N-acetylmuramidase family protein [Paraburkholderia caribensis]ALL68867.1 putative phage-encoded peptidoglycan binding protein [Paraburkholderia caribensis MBA4]
MNHPHHTPQPSAPKAARSSYVEVTFVFRDVLRAPIEGLSVRLIAGAGAPPAPAWKYGPASDNPPDATASTPDSASVPTADSPAQVSNKGEGATDATGFLVTICNAARGQPIDVQVKNRRGEYVWKATVTPEKDISAFTIVSPEYHLEATTKLTPKEEFEQDLNLPVVKQGEVMTIERLVKEFGPYIGWSQKVTEQGKVKKDTPTPKKEVTEDEQTHKKKTKITIEHHYKVVDTGKPTTVVFNVLGSRLNYPSPSTFSEQQYQSIATQLKVETAAVKAIVMQESQGRPFLDNGLPAILYERRHFFAFAVQKQALAEKQQSSETDNHKGKAKKKSTSKNPYPNFPDLCFPTDDNYGPGGLHQYEKLVRASQLDFEIALRSCSWGGFQILGEYYASCGCQTVFEFANRFMSGTDGQAKIFTAFMLNLKTDGVEGLRTHNWEQVARSYNGKYWKKKNPEYATNLAKYYAQFK